VARSGDVGGRVAETFPRLYLALFGLALIVAYARWPILAVDTDLWYHLNAGRYIAAEHAVPHTAFYSFLRPEPHWLDYYWLSQLLLYGGFQVAGYAGMVALRAAVAFGTYGLVLAILRHGKPRDEGWGYTALVFSLVALPPVGRFLVVRPCLFSYLLIPAFLYLLEARRRLWLLPGLGLLWSNLHGIEFPVMELVLGAYLGEWLLARAGVVRWVEPPRRWSDFAWVAGALLTVGLTPHGLELLRGPFQSVAFAAQYIDELKPPALSALFPIQLEAGYLTRPSLITALALLALLSLGVSALRRTIRPAHALLFAGGLVLLLRAGRFYVEFALLVLPLVAALPVRLRFVPTLPTPLQLLLLAGVAIFPFYHLYTVTQTSCPFPLCTRSLPEGSVEFLRYVGARGTVLNHPNDGGYLEWELYPRQQIFVDLQTPFLFSDRDIFVAHEAFQDPVVLASVVNEYHPEFVLVPKKIRLFGAFAAKVSSYVPVFVDDESVLYASSETQPELVARYGLTAIDPFALELVDKSSPEAAARAAAELARANAIYPGGARLRVFEGALALDRGDTETALRIAGEVTRLHPDRPEAFRLRGDALLRREQFGEAAEAYEGALARGGDAVAAGQLFYLESRLWACYARLGKKDEAYRAMKRALAGDVYAFDVGYRELASFASAALDAGRTEEGRTLLEFALAKTPASEAELRRTMETRLRSLSSGR